MRETHPFGSFVPSGSKYLILGSFSGRQAVKGKPYTEDSYDWFYALRRNQFWPILEEVYERDLNSKQSKQELLAELRTAIADIIYQCERKSGNNLDSNLVNIVYAIEEITRIFENNQISRVFFTSRYAEKHFRRAFRDVIIWYPSIEFMTLPSPSPRYARMAKSQKVKRHRELLPHLSVSEGQCGNPPCLNTPPNIQPQPHSRHAAATPSARCQRLACSRQGEVGRWGQTRTRGGAGMTADWPTTFEEAVARLLGELSETDKTALRTMREADLPLLHFSLGLAIRNGFGMWRDNYSLLELCAGGWHRDPDAASMAIIEGAWRQLRRDVGAVGHGRRDGAVGGER
jgi:hypoxanthine-DNA glycosylase